MLKRLFFKPGRHPLGQGFYITIEKICQEGRLKKVKQE